MTTPHTLEQIARETAEKCHQTPGCGWGKDVPIILAALQTATKQPQGADWAEAAAKECCAFSEKWYRGPGKDLPDGSFGGNMSAIIRKHAPLVANREDSERDSKRLDWLDRNCPTYSVGRTINAPESPDPMPFAFKYGLGSRAKTIPFRGSVRHAIDAAMAGLDNIPLPEHMRDLPKVEVCGHGTPKGYYCAECDATMRPAQPERGQGEPTP